MHDSQRAIVSASRALTQYLTRVGRRVLWFKLVRGLAFTAGTAGALLLACALLVGPSLSPLGAVLTWSAVVLGAGLAALVGVGSIDDLRGPRRAKLLRPTQPALSARVRSAAELSVAPNGSPELVAALARSVTDELAELPIAELVPPPKHFRAAASLAAGLALASALTLSTREDALSGLYAMLHPGARDGQGTLSGLWVARLSVRLVYPTRSGRAAEELVDPARIAVPEGTLIELALTPRYAVDRAVLRLGERTLPWTRREDGRLALTFTADESTALSLRARLDGAWITDAKARALVVDQDAAPQVELVAPDADQEVELDQEVPFLFRVSDDHGLEGIDLVVQLGPQRERRQRVTTFPTDTVTKRHEGSVAVVPNAYAVRPGQTIAVWIEARDRDAYGGTNVGRSPVRTLRIKATEEPTEGPSVALLTRARDQALDALAARLETPLEGNGLARARKLARSVRPVIETLDTLGEDYAQTDARDPNRQLLEDMTRRLSKLLRDEAGASEQAALTRLDRALVSELEEDVLWLTDLIGRGKLEAAHESLARLAATRDRMRKLLEQLKSTDDPARRAELLAEVARARAELRELAERLSEAAADVPSDFVNYEALQREARTDPLEQLERALSEGDLAAAEKALEELDERMASLEQGLEGGSEAFRSERFGRRSAQLERAQSELRDLQHGQEQLARETDKLADKARARGEQRESSAARERLAAQSEALERRTRELEAGRVQPAVSEAQRSAEQRLRDVRDALKQGETAEARNMAERAASDLEALALEMRLDARMYPGSDGSRMDAARKAEELARDAERFAEQLNGADATQGEQLSGAEREALRKQAPSQGKLGERAGNLAERARQEGPAPMPRGLERASESMRKAERALERGDLPEAKSAQREALERLRETSDELAQQERASRGGPGGPRGDGRRAGNDTEKVTIPQQGDDARRGELRRRVLDARRAPTPDDYGRSVERYYQEILR